MRIITLRPRQNGRHFADDVFKCIFLNGNLWISIKISLKFVPDCQINNIPALVQIMAWRRPGDKPLSEPRMECLLTHICVTRPQWVITMANMTQNMMQQWQQILWHHLMPDHQLSQFIVLTTTVGILFNSIGPHFSIASVIWTRNTNYSHLDWLGTWLWWRQNGHHITHNISDEIFPDVPIDNHAGNISSYHGLAPNRW